MWKVPDVRKWRANAIGADIAGLGAPEILIVLAILVLLFGAKKLPDLASSMGRSIKEFRKAADDDAGDTTDSATSA